VCAAPIVQLAAGVLATLLCCTGSHGAVAPVPSASPTAAEEYSGPAFDGRIRLFGPSVAGQSPRNLTTLVVDLVEPVLGQLGLALSDVGFGAITRPETQGLDSFWAADSPFRIATKDQPTEPLGQYRDLASLDLISLLLLPLQAQLDLTGFKGTLLLLNVGYTIPAGASADQTQQLSPFQATTTNILVSGEGVGTFGVDKQTLLLAAAMQRLQIASVPALVCINVSAVNPVDVHQAPSPASLASARQPASDGGRRRTMLEENDATVAVQLKYILADPAPLARLAAQVHGPELSSLTAGLGLRLDVKYVNSSGIVVNPPDVRTLVPCDPGPADCGRSADASPAAGPPGARDRAPTNGVLKGVAVTKRPLHSCACPTVFLASMAVVCLLL